QLALVGRVRRRADAECVERDVALVVARVELGVLAAERRVDVDELVAALARAGLDVLDQRLERRADALGVRGLVELRDLRPRLVDVLDRDRPAEPERLAGGALPAQLGE